jgi:hypothetical protein
VVRFELVELEGCRSERLADVLECYSLLRESYPFLEKWGFRYEEHELKVRYSLTDLKGKLRLMRRKIREVTMVIAKLKRLLISEESHMLGAREMARETKTLELVVMYCKTIIAKIDNPKHQDKEIYQLACGELRPLQDRLFELLYMLIYDNKANSEIIIAHSIFFNHLLSLYPDTIGALLEESIRNLCLIKAKIS